MPIHLLDSNHQQKHQLQMNKRHHQHEHKHQSQRPIANMIHSNRATTAQTSMSSTAYYSPLASSTSSSASLSSSTTAATTTKTTTTTTTTTPSSSSSSSSTSRSLCGRHLMLTYFLIVALTALVITEAKPLSQYQVKFRRVPPKEFSAALGSSITIECEAGASPPPTIHWLKDGKRIIQNELDENRLDDDDSGHSFQVDDVSRIALSTSRSRLYIDCADLVDEATYTCVADNVYSRVASQTKLNLIKPIVQAVSNGNNENNLVSDEVAALSALASSSSSASATLKALSGAYKNAASPLSAVPQCLSDRLRLGGSPPAPARIHMWTHNIVEIMKNNVVLLCRSNIKRAQQVQQDINLINGNNKQQGKTTLASNNRPLVSWTLPDDKPVSEDQRDKYELLETGDLLIKNLDWSDMGSYVCTVSDEQSSDSVSSFVYPASVKATNTKRVASTVV